MRSRYGIEALAREPIRPRAAWWARRRADRRPDSETDGARERTLAEKLRAAKRRSA
jgi:hypothetical protein